MYDPFESYTMHLEGYVNLLPSTTYVGFDLSFFEPRLYRMTAW